MPSGSTHPTRSDATGVWPWVTRHSVPISFVIFALALLLIWLPGSRLGWNLHWAENPLRLTLSVVVTFPAFQWVNWWAKYAKNKNPYAAFKRDVVWPLGEVAVLFFAASEIIVFVIEGRYIQAGWDPGTVVALVIAAVVILVEVGRNASEMTTSETALAQSPVGSLDLPRGSNFCTRCGGRREPGQDYCGSCGRRFDAGGAPPPGIA